MTWAATLAARPDAERALVSLEMDEIPRGYEYLNGKATQRVPPLVTRWLEEQAS